MLMSVDSSCRLMVVKRCVNGANHGAKSKMFAIFVRLK